MTRSLPPPGARRAARIAVDLLGGDDAPAVVVDGALQALRADPDLSLLLVGPDPAAGGIHAALPADVRDRAVAHAAAAAVGMDDDPVRGARPGTHVRAAIDLLARGEADAFVSAGSSGATVAAAVVGLGRLPGVRHPALAAVIPATAGPVLLLDVGANPDAGVEDLVRYAILGAAYAHVMGRIDAPRVGLLSVGTEPGKGDRLRRRVTERLAAVELPGRAIHVGNVEGHDVTRGGAADVVITDGFTGNVLLKGMEGAISLAGGDFPPDELVPRAAVLLGVAGTVVICHGAADAPELCSGVAYAARLVRADACARVAAVTGPLQSPAGPAGAAQEVLQ